MDDSVFHRLYDEYHDDLFHFLIYLVGNRTDAEDLSHEVYIRVMRSYERFRGQSSEKTWLFAIAKNVAIDHFRKRSVRQKYDNTHFDWETEPLPADDQLPEQWVEFNEEKSELYRCLNRCTGDQKLVITLRYLQQLSIKETAAILEWTESKVKTTQHRALQKLKQLMNAPSNERGESDE